MSISSRTDEEKSKPQNIWKLDLKQCMQMVALWCWKRFQGRGAPVWRLERKSRFLLVDLLGGWGGSNTPYVFGKDRHLGSWRLGARRKGKESHLGV